MQGRGLVVSIRRRRVSEMFNLLYKRLETHHGPRCSLYYRREICDTSAMGETMAELWAEYSEIITGILGFIFGCGVTITVTKLRQGTNANYANQSRSTVGRDQVGRDARR